MVTSTSDAGTAALPGPRLATDRLLRCGTVAGVLFPVLSFGQAFTRAGFDLRRHSLSSLTLGDLGWLQTVNFVLTGLLAVACAVGLRQVLRPGRADTMGPALVGVYGVAMIGGGIFVPEPAFGWPAGSAEWGQPLSTSNNTLHTVFGIMAFMSLIVAGLVFARRFAGQSRRVSAWYSAAGGVAVFAITALPWSQQSASLRFAAGAVIISGWLAMISWRLRAAEPVSADG
jgi:hypothetical protein